MVAFNTGIIVFPSNVVIRRSSNHAPYATLICSFKPNNLSSSGGKREHPVDEVFGRLPLRVEPSTRPVWKSAKASGES